MRKLRVGLTGGIGSGKSAVAALFAGFGAVIVDADVLARDVVAPGSAGLREIAVRWPEVVTDGVLDRAALAAVVFGDDAARERLNGIIHPRVRALADERERDAPPDSIVIHVVPLLFEGTFWTTCDATLVVIAPRDVRAARIAARDGLDGAQIEARMAAQIDPEDARRQAHFVIENDGSLDDLRRATAEVWSALRATQC